MSYQSGQGPTSGGSKKKKGSVDPGPSQIEIEIYRLRHGHGPQGDPQQDVAEHVGNALVEKYIHFESRHGRPPHSWNELNGGGAVPSGNSSTAQEHDTGANRGTGHGTLHTIATFLADRGLRPNAVAGILGNLEVESSLNPNASNPGEGAIGIAQWEGSRRTELQRFANARGTSETNLNTQLEFLWHELTTGYRNVLNNIQHAGSAAEAARFWDIGPGGINSGTGYENSSGSADQARQNYAAQFSHSGSLPQSGGAGGGGYYANSAGGGGGGRGSLAGFQTVQGLGRLLDTIPELHSLVNQAESGGWDLNRFENAVENTGWWRSHSDTARQLMIQQANDPASYRQAVNQAEYQVHTLARQLGMPVSEAAADGIATMALMTGQTNNQQWLEDQIGNQENYAHVKNLTDFGGAMASGVQQLEGVSKDYGINWSNMNIANAARQLALGHQTVDTYKNQAISYAQNTYPSFSKQLAEGQTMLQIAQPYISAQSNLLEVSPDQITLANGLLNKGLQGLPSKPGEAPSALPIWQFQNEVRNDPRWQYTENARQSAASALVQVGQNWGFNG